MEAKDHGITVSHPREFAGAPRPGSRRASAAAMAAREVFWRAELSGPQGHHGHPGPAYRVRKRALSQHGRVLGPPHRDVHDPWKYLYGCLRGLRGAFGVARWAPVE